MVKKKQVKEMKKVKKVDGKTKEEWEIEVLKSKIEMHKTGFDRYVKVLTRSAFIESCTGGAYFNELFHGLLNKGVETLEFETPDIIKKDKEDLRNKWFFGERIPGIKLTEQEVEKKKLEIELEYHKSLEGWAKHNLNDLGDELKKKIVIDSIEQQKLWSDQFNRNSKLYSKVEELKKQNKKKVVKVTKK